MAIHVRALQITIVENQGFNLIDTAMTCLFHWYEAAALLSLGGLARS